MSESRTVLPAPKLLNLIGIRATENAITLVAKTSSRVALCPVCRKRSARVHSRYARTLSDLPWQGIPVTVHLHVRRFFCDHKACSRTIFAERLPGVAAHYARRTERLDGWFRHVSFALGGEAGSRLLRDLGVVVSGDTLLNHIRSLQLGDHEAPRVLSVDDFAFRRGTRYGTVVVDLEHRRLVDVLPDRSADTFARWLGEHPGVEVVSRDRGGEYAEAATRAAPHAVQVADRFHLLKNLKDVVSRVFRQHEEILDLVPRPMNRLQRLTNLRLDREASKERTKERTRELFGSIHALSKKGMKNAQVARELGIHRHTVERYLAFKTPPVRRHFTKKVSAIAPYEDYILGRWEQGCRNATQIWREISEQGYPGAYQNVWRITRYLKGSRSAWRTRTGPSARHLGQPRRRHPGEETGEPLRRRDPHTPEIEDGPPHHGAVLHLVRGVRRYAQGQGPEEQRAGAQAIGGMDRAGEDVRHRRDESLRRQAVAGLGSRGSRDDSALQPGTNRRKGKQTQAREALDVRARKVRPPTPARALRGELKERAS